MPDQVGIELTDRAVRADRDENIKAQHRRRQHERKCDYRLDNEFPAPFRKGEPVGDRQPDNQQDTGRQASQFERDPDRQPIHNSAFATVCPTETGAMVGSSDLESQRILFADHNFGSLHGD